MVTFFDSMQFLSLELFDAAFAVTPESEDEVKRRFMTLFVHGEGSHRGGSAVVCRATNTLGETFAVKRLRIADGETTVTPTPAPDPARKELRHSASGSGSATPNYVTRGHVSAFFEEYRIHLALSELRGFPKLYGFGLSAGNPLIIMEWVEGETLRDAVRASKEPMPLMSIAQLGIAVLSLLERAGELSDHFVHRDLSPRNIMLRTDRTPAAEQLATGDFDLCLIDFGSSSLMGSDSDASFTRATNVWRMGTPTYAPPEMLTSDIAFPQDTRQSSAIDVYALCSVLFELYGGVPPFDLSADGDLSPYRIKTETNPRPLEPRKGDGGALAAIIRTGLSAQQQDRPTIAQLKAAFENWIRLPDQKSIGDLRGASPTDLAFWQPDYASRTISRRRAISGAIVGVAALASSALVAHKLRGAMQPKLDETRYQRASEPYQGDPLYLGFDGSLGGWALYAADGTVACKPTSSRPCGPLSEGLVALFDDISQRYGFIAPTGTGGGYGWMILPRFAQVLDFAEGLAATQDAATGLWGYVDETGTWAIEPRFAEAAPFSYGSAAVRLPQSPLWGAIDDAGMTIIEPAFAALGRRSDEGFAAAQGDSGRWGIVDEAGDWVAEASFAQVRRFNCGLAPALDDTSGLWGFIDEGGSWAIMPTFADARPLYRASDGASLVRAAVKDAASQLWHFIQQDGSSDAEARFWKLGDLHAGLAPAQATADDDRLVFDEQNPSSSVEGVGMRYGYVDANGSWQMRQLVTLTDTRINPAEI